MMLIHDTTNQPLFETTVTTNSPVTEGDDLDVEVEIENIGSNQGTQDLDATFDSSSGFTDKSENDKTLSPGQTYTFVDQTWSTSQGDAGTYTYTITTENTSENGTLEVQSSTSPVSATIHEGGGNTTDLAWGTTGDKSIKLPNPNAFGVPFNEFCMGDQCTKHEGRKPVNDPSSTRTEYVNRDKGQMNGTIYITNKLNPGTGQDLCIGSGCLDNSGSAPNSDLYETSGQGDGPMDGPIVFHSQFANPAIVTDSNVCMGNSC